MENKLSFLILRIGLGITFFWIGILILQDPIGWSGMVKQEIQNLFPVPIKIVMLNTAILDIAVGIFLINNFFPFLTWAAAVLGAFHLIIVLIATGIDAVTVRDIGLLGGVMAVALKIWPEKIKFF